MSPLRRLWNVVRRSRIDDELRQELDTHLALIEEEGRRAGLTAEHARQSAQTRFGNPLAYRERALDAVIATWFEDARQDVRFAIRQLRKAPGFTVIAVTGLALGIGVNAAIFSLLNVLVLRPLGYQDPDRVAFVLGWNETTQEMRFNLPLADVDDIRAQATSFDGVAAYAYWDANLSGGTERPERLQAYRVGASTFDLLGARPLYGRTLEPGDGAPDAPDAAVLSYQLWQRRFGADPAVVGSAIRLDERTYSVVGVMPRTFEFPVFNYKGEVWTALKTTPGTAARGSPLWVVAVARLKDDVSYERAQAEVRAIMDRLAADYPDTNRGVGARVIEMSRLNTDIVTPALIVLAVSVALILFLVCANIANLLLARATTRGRELAVRAALGAGRARIVRQLLTESLLLAFMGAAAGLVAAFWALRALRANLPDLVRTTVPHVFDLGVDGSTLAFTIGLVVLCTVLFGMAPALRAGRLDLNDSLKQGSRGTGGPGHHRLRAALIVAEVAVSLVMLVAAGLLVRSFAQLQQVDLGFATGQVATMTISLPDYRYPDAASYRRYVDEALAGVRQVPGVRSAGFVNVLPFSGYNGDTRYAIDGEPPPAPGQEPSADYRVATPGYFTALEIPLHAGRAFDSRDRSTTALVAIVNRALVRRAFGDRNPLGRRIRLGLGDGAPWRTIIGVVGDVGHSEIDERRAPEIFLPFEQAPQSMMMLAASTTGDPEALTPSILAALAGIDASQPVYHVKPMSRLVKDAMLTSAFATSMMSFLGLLALVLATIGIYGVVSYAVNQQVPEFGVRLALGASPADLLRLVAVRSLTLIGAGVALGLAGAAGIVRLMRGFLYGVTASDPATFVAALGLLAAVAAVACLIPARRAMRTDPVSALKAE
ncbi:MAG TPA: ABC transporter permease [Vicinamibacterales bacterium]|nr:ABC transporter permease [Vicinamibacterales bacterium]